MTTRRKGPLEADLPAPRQYGPLRHSTIADLDETPLLNEPNVMLVALKTVARGPGRPEDCLRRLAASMRQAGLSLPSDTGPIRRRIESSYRHLHIARLIERGSDSRYLITPRGRETLRAHPKGIDASVLVRFPEYRRFIRRPRGEPGPPRSPRQEYDEGYIAGLAGRLITDNPYSHDNIAHLEWENGWCEAMDEERADFQAQP